MLESFTSALSDAATQAMSQGIDQLPDPLRRTVRTAEFLASEPVRKAKTGHTPNAVIHRQHKAALRYFPSQHAEGALFAPLFVSMPLINTWTCFDLLPGRSVVEKLVTAGVPVYMLDWGRPGPEDSQVPLSQYIDGILVRAIKRASRHARDTGHPGAGKLDVLGYCVGGSFLSVAVARHPELQHSVIRRMALLAAPIDFHASGRLAAWAKPETFPLDEIVDGYQNFPPHLMAESFSWLKPMGQWQKWRTLTDRIDDDGFREVFAAMEQWNGDNVPFPGEAYREYVRRCYFDNALMSGAEGSAAPRWMLDGKPVDLSQGTVPALAIGASTDHICPPAAAHGLARTWGGPVETLTVRGGHVGVCIGSGFPRALLGWIEQGAEAAPAAVIGESA